MMGRLEKRAARRGNKLTGGVNMKRFNHGIKWTLAAILIAGVTAAPVMAEKTTPATG